MVTPNASPQVFDAIVLAAGNGDRFASPQSQSKLLYPVLGVPLIARTLRTVASSGIRVAHVVLGFQAEQVRAAAEASFAGLTLRFCLNPHWRQENGLSVLAARGRLGNRCFALLMGDHVFRPESLAALLSAPRAPGESLLAVDPRPVPAAVAMEATKVRLARGRVAAIGKDLNPFDAIDTGLFVCDGAIFTGIEEACRDGDTSLTGGVRRLAAQGFVRGLNIAAPWWDIDRVEDVAIAEALLANQG